MNVIPIASASRFTASVPDADVSILSLPIAPQAVCRTRFAAEAKAGQALTPVEALLAVDRYKGLQGVELVGSGDPPASMAALWRPSFSLKNGIRICLLF